MRSLGKYIIYGIYLVVLLIGLLLGYLIFGGSNSAIEPIDYALHSQQSSFTCSMHPNVLQEEKGACPICGMDLVKVSVNVIW